MNDTVDHNSSGFLPRARKPAVTGAAAVFGRGLTKTMTVVAAIVISTAVPRNGARQEMVPSVPPTSGPSAIPKPTAASYKMIAEVDPPDEAPTMPASAIVTNSALPNLHP